MEYEGMSQGGMEAVWSALAEEHAALADGRIVDLFRREPERAESFSVSAAGLLLDYSKNRISRRARELLLSLARHSGIEEKIHAMFTGERINATEDRAVLHTALRDCSGREVLLDGVDVCALARSERERMLAFVADVHAGRRLGASGKPLDTVVNIGIGGSDLGPLMAVEALRPYWIEGRRSFFVSNVDGQHLADTLQQINPETTLFIVASKTFTTQETMTNARSALDWYLARGGSQATVQDHFAALSTNLPAVEAFGISPECTFGFWDWVGGRYSLWSSIGLSIALQVGAENYLSLLEGAFEMDEHFRSAAPEENLPLLLALVGVWNRNIEALGVHAVLPYDQHLHRLPAYLQQLDMESNGKSVRLDGARASRGTGPVIFGEPGTNGQHAFYQLLHQGTDRVSADFIAAIHSASELGDHHLKLLANLLAQPRALMCGKSRGEVQSELHAQGLDEAAVANLAEHRVFDGDRPSNVILCPRLSPNALGSLIAMYEHKVFCQGVIWGINSFDQWGVELGKHLASQILPMLEADELSELSRGTLDPSTLRLLQYIRELRRVT